MNSTLEYNSFFILFDMILCITGWPWIHYVVENALNFWSSGFHLQGLSPMRMWALCSMSEDSWHSTAAWPTAHHPARENPWANSHVWEQQGPDGGSAGWVLAWEAQHMPRVMRVWYSLCSSVRTAQYGRMDDSQNVPARGRMAQDPQDPTRESLRSNYFCDNTWT